MELTALKHRLGLEWLKEADSQALQESLRDLDRAFVNFFEKRAWFPKFKRAKDERCAFRIPQRVKVEGEQVYCPKIGWIDLCLSRPVEGVTKSASFKRDASGHWHVCLIQEFELPEVALPVPQNPVGVDVGLMILPPFPTARRFLPRSLRAKPAGESDAPNGSFPAERRAATGTKKLNGA